MTPAERALAASIRQTFSSAYEALTSVENVSHHRGDPNDPDFQEEYDDACEGLAHSVEKLFRDIKLLAERLGAPATAVDITRVTPSHDEASDFTISNEGDFTSKHIRAAYNFFQSLDALTDGKDVTGLTILETILDSTPKIVTAFKLEPKNEKGVQDAMAQALRFAFPDVVREFPISKNLKVYKPDFGVRSLHAAVEYKFIDSAIEAKKSLDDTYTDMKGYGGTFEWRHFYAVYYMTDTFFTQRDVTAEYKLVNAGRNWTPLVVVGKGAREKKLVSAPLRRPIKRRPTST